MNNKDKLITLKNGTQISLFELNLRKLKFNDILLSKIILSKLCEKYKININDITKENLTLNFYSKYNEIIKETFEEYKVIPSLNSIRFKTNKKEILKDNTEN